MRFTGCFVCVAVVLFAASEVRAGPVTLYDVDFNSDTVGTAPATDAGPPTRTGPSSVTAFSEGGSATVVSSFGSLTNKPLQLRAQDLGTAPTLGGANVVFSLTSPGFSGFNSYEFEGDILLTNLSGSAGAGVFLDSPIHTIRFENNGNIDIIDPNGTTNIGTYSAGDVFRVGIFIDTVSSQWSVSLDGTQVYSASSALSFLSGFRVAHTSGSSNATDIYLDNVLIVANPVPEPGAWCLLAVAGLLFVARKRSIRARA